MPTVTEPLAGPLDLKTLRERIDTRLAGLLPAETLAPQNLSRAIRYAALAPASACAGR